jgi:hypothetical protein
MSQIYKSLASGPVPPSVPTQFTTDDGSIAIPVANNLNVLSVEVTDNNLNGIQTRANPNLSDFLYVELTNRLLGGASTNDGSTHTIITFPLGSTPAVFSFDGFISGLNTTNPSGASFFYSAGVRTDGITATEPGVEFTNAFLETGMSLASVGATTSGNNLLITVTGIPGNNITWLAQATYSRTP